MVGKRDFRFYFEFLTEIHQTINRLAPASRVWGLIPTPPSAWLKGREMSGPPGDVKIYLCLIAGLHWHAIKNKRSRDHLIKTIGVWITTPTFASAQFLMLCYPAEKSFFQVDIPRSKNQNKGRKIINLVLRFANKTESSNSYMQGLIFAN